MSVKGQKSKIATYTILSVLALIQILPLVAALLNSFRTDKAIKKLPVAFPEGLNWSNYVKAWQVGEYGQAFVNSIIISLSVTTVVALLALLAGYFLVRSDIRIKNMLFVYFGVAVSLPVFSYLVPLYYTFANLGLVNTHQGLILIFIATNLPFNILLARTYILGIPKELSEAAVIDGCSTLQIIGKIIFPVAKPIITTIVLIVFVATWNEFTIANTFLQEASLKTAATKYVLFVGERGSDMSMIYTAGIITILPIVLAFIALQNYFVEGMTAGSIK